MGCTTAGGEVQSGDIDARIVVNLAAVVGNLKMINYPLPEGVDPPPAVTAGHVASLDTGTTDIAGTSRAHSLVAAARTTGNTQTPGYVALKGSGVSFAPKRISLVDNTVTINIKNMNKDGYVELTYRKMWASDETEGTESLFSVEVASDSDTLAAPAANAAKGAILERPGSGTIEVSDTAVEVKTAKDFTITYTASTQIEDAYFIVQIPPNAFEMPNTDDDTQLVPLTLTDPTHPAPGTFGQATDDVDTGDVDETRPHPNGDSPRFSVRTG